MQFCSFSNFRSEKISFITKFGNKDHASYTSHFRSLKYISTPYVKADSHPLESAFTSLPPNPYFFSLTFFSLSLLISGTIGGSAKIRAHEEMASPLRVSTPPGSLRFQPTPYHHPSTTPLPLIPPASTLHPYTLIPWPSFPHQFHPRPSSLHPSTLTLHPFILSSFNPHPSSLILLPNPFLLHHHCSPPSQYIINYSKPIPLLARSVLVKATL